MSMVLDAVETKNVDQMEVFRMKAPEEALGREVSIFEEQACAIDVSDDVGFVLAAEKKKEVKRMQKVVKEYWEDLRLSTKKAYDDVINKRKQMMKSLESAESILDKKMNSYAEEKERIRIEQERQMRIAAEQEMKQKQVEAEKAIEEGNEVVAEYAMAEVEVMEGVAKAGRIESQIPKVDGVSVRKNWEIINIDSSKVPVTLNGMELRPVDTKAVMNLIKASKGTIQIPGIQYKETVNISVRS